MSKTLTVARREFTQTVLRKTFLVAILGIPVLVVVGFGLAVLVMVGHREPPLQGTVAVVGPADLAEAVRLEFDPEHIAAEQQRRMAQAAAAGRRLLAGAAADTEVASDAVRMGMGVGKVHVTVEAVVEPQAIESIKQRVRPGSLLAAAAVPEALLAPAGSDEPFLLYVAEGVDSDHAGFIERCLARAVVRTRAARAGLDADTAMSMLQQPESDTRRLQAGGQETREGEGQREIRQMIPMLFMMLLWIAVFSSGQHLMMSTIEEKSTRVMEVLLSAVSPLQLMAGKILGHGAVGLLIVLIYSGLTLAGLVYLGRLHWINVADMAYLFVYFFMAFVMIAAIMAAVGSAVTDIREANTLVAPLMFVVMIPLFLWLPISQSPNGGIATAFSFIPPAIPFVMILRVAADEPVPLWQVPATILWGYACMLGMVWLAARIFRVGVLMYGKPPSPMQIIKWARYT